VWVAHGSPQGQADPGNKAPKHRKPNPIHRLFGPEIQEDISVLIFTELTPLGTPRYPTPTFPFGTPTLDMDTNALR